MKMKKFLSLAAVAMLSASAYAQYEGTSFDDRIGHGQDSIEVRQNVSMFLENYKQRNWKDAYENWKFIMEKAPIARLDTYTRGVTMFEQMIAQSQDKAQQKAYLTELLGLYDTRLQNADALNSWSEIKTTRGPVLCRKAYDYAHFAPSIFEDYTLDKAYDGFTEGINLVNQDPSIEIEGFVLSEYFQTSFKKFQAAPDAFREQFLNDYLLCKEVCEKMLAKANETENKEEAAKIVRQYDPVYDYVNKAFASSNAASKDQIRAIYENKVDEKKDDINYLKSAILVLQDNYCDDEDFYFKAANYAYNIKPEYYSAIGMGDQQLKDGKIDEALNYYNKAVELCIDELQKAQISYEIANLLGRKGQISKAEPFLTQTEQLAPSFKGKCDLYRARRDASEKKFDSAIEFANKAAEEDPSISGTATRLAEQVADWKVSWAKYEEQQKAEQERLAQIRAEQERLRAAREAQLRAEQQQAAAARAKENAQARAAREAANAKAKAEYDRKMAEYNKRKAEYDAQVARQKKLDDFWKGK